MWTNCLRNSEASMDGSAETEFGVDEARRDDLGNAIGFIVSAPFHGQDETGQWFWGLRPFGGMANPDLTNQFRNDMARIARDGLYSVVGPGLLTSPQAEAIEGHPYEIGPAAQSWPMFFYNLYQDARPFLNDGASLLAWGAALRAIMSQVKTWGHRQTMHPQRRESPVESVPALTLPAILSLAYSDLVERYGIGEEVTLDLYPRSFKGFVSVGHPGSDMRYVIRALAGVRSFFYIVDSSGVVYEHFLYSSGEITPLSLPDWYEYRDQSFLQPQPSRRFRVAPPG